ncbi:unnamed protein product [Heligmosomoides polygyrus]|uniref:Uncharacterized protein n=1 Tax=Heligmosomoides polygyrus TaxID=6339 RepID=A0A3P8BHP8_HELPZ|nr:unnamed protein product [Heligmosomoides polygyrus]
MHCVSSLFVFNDKIHATDLAEKLRNNRNVEAELEPTPPVERTEMLYAITPLALLHRTLHRVPPSARVGDGSRPAGACEAHYVAGPPNFRQLGPCDRVSDLRTSAKLGTPEAFSHLRESCHSEHRPLDSTLRDADRVLILLSYSPGL